MSEDPGERPRWSFTWMVRIQRVGRRHVLSDRPGRAEWWLRLLPWLLATVIVTGAVVLVWAGVLPR